MLISRDRQFMGEYRNGKLASIRDWATTVSAIGAGTTGICTTPTGAGG